MYVPSAAISWVAPQNAMTAKRAILYLKNPGKGRLNAIKANRIPMANWVKTTKNFFVL